MSREKLVRELLGLSPDDVLEERGVFPSPPADRAFSEALGEPAEAEGALSADLLVALGLGTEVMAAAELSAALPRGIAHRFAVEPRVVELAGLPELTAIAGPVRRRTDGAWLVDSRRQPSALAMPADHGEVVICAEGGRLWLFRLRRARAPAARAPAPTTR